MATQGRLDAHLVKKPAAAADDDDDNDDYIKVRTQHLLTFFCDLFPLIVPLLYHLLSSVSPFVLP